MKTLSLTTIMLCLCATHLFGQSCNLSDFLKLRLSDKETVNSALLACNLTPYDADDFGRNKVQVTYKNNDDLKTAQFYQWVDFVYAGNGKASGTNRISFQTQNQTLVTNYLKEMQALGFKYVRKKIVDRQIYEVYANNTHTIDVITSQSRYAYEGGVYVNFAIYDTNEYETVFLDENQKYTIQTENNNAYANFSAGIGE
ncbi:MAG TPA: hypothetical protein PK431_11535 [Chitinophagales bacterium]|nr:hypothetical protein [Chitinophagales bacterium]